MQSHTISLIIIIQWTTTNIGGLLISLAGPPMKQVFEDPLDPKKTSRPSQTTEINIMVDNSDKSKCGTHEKMWIDPGKTWQTILLLIEEMIWYNWLISRSHSLDQHHIHGGTTEIEHKRTNKWHETFWWISFFKCFGYLSQWLPSFDGPVGSVRWTNKLDG